MILSNKFIAPEISRLIDDSMSFVVDSALVNLLSLNPLVSEFFIEIIDAFKFFRSFHHFMFVSLEPSDKTELACVFKSLKNVIVLFLFDTKLIHQDVFSSLSRLAALMFSVSEISFFKFIALSLIDSNVGVVSVACVVVESCEGVRAMSVLDSSSVGVVLSWVVDCIGSVVVSDVLVVDSVVVGADGSVFWLG